MTTSFSVIRSCHEPAATEQVVHEAEKSDRVAVLQGVVLKSDVPLVAGPGFAFPPVAGEAPGAGLPEHVALHVLLLTHQMRRLAVFQSYMGAQRRAGGRHNPGNRFFVVGEGFWWRLFSR